MTLRAENLTITGKVIDFDDRSPLIGTTIILFPVHDSSHKMGTTTDPDGVFKLENIPSGRYQIRLGFMGYRSMEFKFMTDRNPKDLGILKLKQDTLKMQDVNVEVQRVYVEQSQDTTHYNATSYKTNPDASAEDLVTKMPGITVESNTVKAHGEEVKQVLVDGKPFFDQDPIVALKNFPADVISQVQVFDKLSDQAQFTGFDDGQSSKTMNIVTKPDRTNGQFGKIYGGYGQDNRYQSGGNLNFFKGSQRISLILLSNNINQQNFSIEDLMGVLSSSGRSSSGRDDHSSSRSGDSPRSGGRGGNEASNFLVGPQSGTSTTHAVGINYTQSIKKKLELNGSYFFNYANNENKSRLMRNYFMLDSVEQAYSEEDYSDSWNDNHRLNFKAELKIDSTQSFILNPRLSYQENESESWLLGRNIGQLLQPMNQTETSMDKVNEGYRLSNSALYRRKLNKPGRTVSLIVSSDLNNKDNYTTLSSQNNYYSIIDSIYHFSQATPTLTDGYSLGANLSYTEPLSRNSQLQFNYNPIFTHSQTDKQNYYFDSLTNLYTTMDTSLSNIYAQNQKNYQVGLNYRFRSENSNLMVGSSFQKSRISGEQTFPYSYQIDKDYTNLLPGFMLNHKFNDQINLRWFYRTSTNPPSVSQLQDVIDNSNPLQLVYGNPDLKQEFRHSTMMRLSLVNFDKTKSMFLIIFGSMTQDYIGTMTLLSDSDTTHYKGITLPTGTQLTQPINLSDSYSLRSFLTYGRPLGFISSNLNLNGGLSYSLKPGQLNTQNYKTETYTTTLGTAINSTISENFDFSIGYTANFNKVKKEINQSDNSDYFSHTVITRFNLIFPGNWVLRSDLIHTLYNGLGEDYDQSYNLWNVSLGKKFLPSRALELSLSIFDILGQNSSISRTIADYYVEDTQNQVIERYIMVLLTYKIQNFNRFNRG